jgi:hypothetical protein
VPQFASAHACEQQEAQCLPDERVAMRPQGLQEFRQLVHAQERVVARRP